MIRIVLVDDQELVRTGLRALAERDGDIVVAGEAANGAAGLHKVAECLPDVVLMDIRCLSWTGWLRQHGSWTIPREREVLTEIGRGLSNQEISQSLFISPATARTYVSRLLAKLHARDRSQLVVLAYETGLVTPGSR